MPDVYPDFDMLVLPSLTRPNWKEQFGRVLIEAMACGVPVIGSDSGEIPNVIGDAGLIFPEGNIPALRDSIAGLLVDPAAYARYALAGRSRVAGEVHAGPDRRRDVPRVLRDSLAARNNIIRCPTANSSHVM